MTIWMSGELQADVGDSCAAAQNGIERVINNVINKRDYGAGVVEWALIPTILNPQFEKSTGYAEIRRYWRAKRETEFRLRIDHARFKAADDAGKRRLIFEMILRSVNEARAMKIPAFDLDRFAADLKDIGAEHGWM